MSTKAERGTKRTCQNPECGGRFYDLNRDPIVCPICQMAYERAVGTAAMAAAAPVVAEEKVARKPAKKPAYAVDAAAKPEDAPVAEGEEVLPAIEGEEEPAAAETTRPSSRKRRRRTAGYNQHHRRAGGRAGRPAYSRPRFLRIAICSGRDGGRASIGRPADRTACQ
jgi:uncharacterized protein (TIGR02300 family)